MGKGSKSHTKKIEKFKKLHPEGRKEYAKKRKQEKVARRKAKLESAKIN